MSWRDRAPRGAGPPPKSLDFIASMMFVVDGADTSGKEYVKVYDRLVQGERVQATVPLHRHALAFLQRNGHVTYNKETGRWSPVIKESP